MKNNTLIGKTVTKSHGSLTRRYTVESIIEQDGWHIACLREIVAPHGIIHQKSTSIAALTNRLR